MTLGIVLACDDGVVVGSDTKTVRDKGVEIQRHTSKITEFELANGNPILCCHAGAKTVAERALGHINPQEYGDDRTSDFSTYMTQVVEMIIPKFASDYRDKHGDIPDIRFGMGTIEGDEPVISTIYPTGEFDYDEQYTAVGSGSLLAEHFLRDPYVNELSLDRARLTVGFIISIVSDIDSNVEGLEVYSISNEGDMEELSMGYEIALQSQMSTVDSFDMDLGSDIDMLAEMAEGITDAMEEDLDDIEADVEEDDEGDAEEDED